MGYAEFLRTLLDEGRVAVSPPAPVAKSEIQRADTELTAFEQRYRHEMPGDAPRLHLQAAQWAGINFYQACRFAVYRDADEAAMDALMQSDYSAAASAAVHYSIDIVFRFLPDLMRIAKQAAPNDPLVARLQHWACCWPLSSIGMQGVKTVEIGAIAASPSLLVLYVDRVFASSDSIRLQDEHVVEAARRAVGAYPELAGPMAPRLAVAKQHLSIENL